MQRFAFLILLLILSQATEAQRRNPNAGANAARQDTSGLTTDIREKLVHLAMQNPEFEIADRQVVIASENVKLAKLKFLGRVTAQVNYNEYSFKKTQTGDLANFYPKYNLGLGIPFDMFFTRGKEINIARENLGIAEASKNQSFRIIKAQVLAAYEDYLMHKQKLDFQNQVAEDVKTVYQQKERDFSEGIISAEEYYPAFRQWTDELSRKAEQQRNFNVAKLTLESMIGMTLEEAIAKP
jgi:outer membrane protein TolC